ncbi:MAG TPA: type II CAAX endopeptidase family protein [Vicinamibacterales bacterium]|nr:type II CAAX endopeptidase family protein [Vicinamibacterales bacterium]
MEPIASPEPPAPSRDHVLAHRVVAFLEVLICSDYLTQFAIGGTLRVLGFAPTTAGRLDVAFVVALSLGDAVLLVALILIMLVAHGEHPREVLFGRRSVAGEAALGVPLVAVALIVAGIVILTIQRFAPSLHTVPENPLQDLMRSPRDAWLFALVVFVAGGFREEIQRAFLLHRFEVWLGGPVVGVLVTSIGFGAGHLVQGVDAAITTGLLGAFWGVIYLRRRSAAAPIVSHSGFDLVQIVPYLLGRGSA